ncbi:hypothetical protein SM139_3527, partial [Stenotrophomonas maltophilia]
CGFARACPLDRRG